MLTHGSLSLGRRERVRVQLPRGRSVSVKGAGFVRFIVSFKQSQQPSEAGATARHTRGHLGTEEPSDRPRPPSWAEEWGLCPGSLAASPDSARELPTGSGLCSQL